MPLFLSMPIVGKHLFSSEIMFLLFWNTWSSELPRLVEARNYCMKYGIKYRRRMSSTRVIACFKCLSDCKLASSSGSLESS